MSLKSRENLFFLSYRIRTESEVEPIGTEIDFPWFACLRIDYINSSTQFVN